MPTARLQIEPRNSSVAEFSAARPNSEFRYLASRRVADAMYMIVEVEKADIDGLVRTFDEAPEVRSYEVLRTDQDSTIVQYVETPEPAPISAARAAGIMPQYPVILRGGWLVVETITSRDGLSRLKSELETSARAHTGGS